MQREQLERYQVWFYLPAILAGHGAGSAAPETAPHLGAVLWPSLGVLLYSTFTPVPLKHLSEAFPDRWFMGAALLGNFVLLPIIVWGLIALLPDQPAIRLGVLLVLLVPCTDWFVTFAHLGGGDTRRAIAVTPVNLLIQIALLPLYLWLFMGETFIGIVAAERIASVSSSLSWSCSEWSSICGLCLGSWCRWRPVRSGGSLWKAGSADASPTLAGSLYRPVAVIVVDREGVGVAHPAFGSLCAMHVRMVRRQIMHVFNNLRVAARP